MNYYIVHIFIYMNSQTILKRVQLKCHGKKKTISEPKVQDLHSFNVKVKRQEALFIFPRQLSCFTFMTVLQVTGKSCT